MHYLFQVIGLPITFILWYINPHKPIATYSCPAFCPNTTTSPWLYGTFIVFLGSTRCIQGTGFSLYHYRACSLYNCLCELHPCTHYMGNYTKRTLSIWDISFHVYLYLNCRHVSCSKSWFPYHFLSTPDSCFMCTFFSCCIIFNKIMNFRWLWYVFT